MGNFASKNNKLDEEILSKADSDKQESINTEQKSNVMGSNSSKNSNLAKKKLSNIESFSLRIPELFGYDNSTDDDDNSADDYSIPHTKWLNGSDNGTLGQSNMSTLLKSPIYSYNEENIPISLAYETGYNNRTLEEEHNEIIEKYVTNNSCVMSSPNILDLESGDLGLYDLSTLCKDSKILNEKLAENIPIELKEIDNSTGLNSPDLNNLYLNNTQVEGGALYQNNRYDQSASYYFFDDTSEISLNSFLEPYQSNGNTNESVFQLLNNISTSIDTNSDCNLEQCQVIDSKDCFDCEVMTSSQNTVYNNGISILSRSTSESEINNAHYESSGVQKTKPNSWLSSFGNFLNDVSTFLRDDLFSSKKKGDILKQKDNQKYNSEPTITHNCIPVELEVEDPNLGNSNLTSTRTFFTSDNTESAPPTEEFIRNFYENGSNSLSQLDSTPEHKMVSSHDICIPIQISNSDKNLPEVSTIFHHQDENFDQSSTTNLSLPSLFEQQTYTNPSLNIKNEVNSFKIENKYEVSTNKDTDLSCFQSESGVEKEDTLNSVLKKKGSRREYSHENPFLTESDLESEDETNIENVFENFYETEDEDIKVNSKLTTEDNEMPEQVVKIPLVHNSENVELDENYDLETNYNKKKAEIFEGKYINKDNASSVLNLENADIEMQDISITRHENKYDSMFDIDSEDANYFSKLIKNSNGQLMKVESYDELMPNIDTRYTNEEGGTPSYDFTDHKKVFHCYPSDAPPETSVDYPQNDDDEDYKKQYTCDGCGKMFLLARALRTHATICKIFPQPIPEILSTNRICTDSPNIDMQENNSSELFDIIKKKPSTKLYLVTTAAAKVNLIKTSQGLEKHVMRMKNSTCGKGRCDFCKHKDETIIIKEQKGPIVDNSAFMFPCRNCKKSYKRKKNMLQHLESHYLKLVCNYCEKTYASPRTLNTHLKKCPKMPVVYVKN